MRNVVRSSQILLLAVLLATLFTIAVQSGYAQGRKRSDVQIFSTVLRREGFFPPKAKAKEGVVYFLVQNRLGVDANLRVEREQGNARGVSREFVRGGTASLARGKWLDSHNFTPGEYVISVDGMPELTFHLSVTANGR